MNHPLAEGPYEFGKITLAQADYREFVCSLETYEYFAFGGGFTHLDGVPVKLQIMDTLVGGFNVVVKIWAADDGVSVAHVQPANRLRRVA